MELLIHAICIFFPWGWINIFLLICRKPLYIKDVNCLSSQLQTVLPQFVLCSSVLLLVFIDIKKRFYFLAEIFLSVFCLSSASGVILSDCASLICHRYSSTF